MKSIKNYLFLTVLIGFSFGLQAQSEVKSYDLKKGQAFDIIFIRQKQGAEEVQKKYFETAYPIALKMGYGALGVLSIKESPLQGNYHPNGMIMGTWPSINIREKFMTDIETSVPEFHQMRKDIWSNFDVTYWEMKEDISIQVNSSKFNVVTAYWAKENQPLEKFKRSWLKQSEKSGGKKLLELSNGKSPFGYEYNPEFIVITQWENKEAYDLFYEKSINMDRTSVKQVHQFIIQ